MTTLVLARHGETIWHADDRYAGSSDIPLTSLGERQALRLADWASTADLRGVWSSDLVRAGRTAEPCAAAAGLTMRVDPRLREVDFGDAEGMNGEEIEARFPGAYQAFERDPIAHHLPGGEAPDAATERALTGLRDICTAQPDGRVLVVGHGTLIRLVLCRYLGIPLEDYRRRFPTMRNCSLTEIRIIDDEAGVISFNETPMAETDRP
ncbi:MAG: histidine phosphatase family protein [Jiangellaceae bacterium]